MFAFPKLVLLMLVIAAVWIGYRWLNGRRRASCRGRRRTRRGRGRRIQAEDLVACGVCGAYVAASARGCGRPGCPRPRLIRTDCQAVGHQLPVADPRPAALLGGAGLRHPAALRCRGRRRHLPSGDGACARSGPKPWRAAYVQPSRRPTDGRYGENPNRLQHYYQFQVILKPAPADSQELYLASLAALGIDAALHDIRFVEDDWESPTLGAWGLGWEVWLDGMEVSQFTYFQQVGGIECDPVSTELTYGLERLAMYVQGVESVYRSRLQRRRRAGRITYGDVFKRAEREFSAYNFELADTATSVRSISPMPRRNAARARSTAAWRCRPMTSA